MAGQELRPPQRANEHEEGTMAATLTVYDETLSGERTHSLTLAFLTERTTVRELIRRRVYEEVQEYNLQEPDYFRGLVQPTDAERVLNGYRLRQRRKIDWEEQYQRAVEAFERNGFLILVDDRQAEHLDEEIEIRLNTQVSFVRLVPLVGG
jgi:hypothetical protein